MIRGQIKAVSGFSLIELMISITIGLILTGGVITLFINNKVTYETTDNLSRLQENARFALNFMIGDLRMAGYFGCNNDSTAVSTTVPNLNPLVGSTTGLEGFDQLSASWSPSGDTSIVAARGGGALGNAIANTDGVTIRRLSGTNIAVTSSTTNSFNFSPNGHNFAALDFAGVEDCRGSDIFQISAIGANSVTANANTSREYLANTNPLDPSNPRVAPFLAVRYYIGTGTNGPSLFRETIQSGLVVAEELIEGVESMHLLYGVDGDGDNAPDTYVVAGDPLLDSADEWQSVMTVRIAMLLRTLAEYGPTTEIDNKQYRLNDFTFVAPGDRFKRRIFNTTVQLRNRLT